MPTDSPQERATRGGVPGCAGCGGPLASDQRYCLRCGRATRDVLRALVGAPRSVAPAPAPREPPVGRWRAALTRPVPIGWLAALGERLAALSARVRAPLLRPVRRTVTAERARCGPWPWSAPVAVPALACALGAGVLMGALAGPPATGSAAGARRVAAAAPTASAAGVAAATASAAGAAPATASAAGPAGSTTSAASLAGDLAALQAQAPPPPPPPPPPTPPPAGAPTASDAPPAASVAPTTATNARKPARTAKRKAAVASKPAPPPVKHVVVVALADKDFAEAFGHGSQAPYLARELRSKGALLSRYFATAHGSLPNYLALLSGQSANPDTATGCPALTPFVSSGKPASDGQIRGKGCVFDASVPSLPGQLERRKLAWRAYVDGVADPPLGAPAAPCPPPAAAPDGTPPVVDRDPFAFLAAITGAPDCTAKVTGLGSLAAQLAAPLDTSPAFTLIVPDACDAGRDGACPAGEPGGLARSDGWLRAWIPRIMASPAYADDGMIVITFDQARVAGREADSTSCCGQALGVDEPASVDPLAPAPGGGRVGALVLSPRVKAGSVSDVPYNHFALLRTIEDAFGLHHLGLAGADGLKPLGKDVFAPR
jgi:hypothetical protein